MKNHRLFLSTILTLFTLSVCAQAERIQKRDYNKYANYDEGSREFEQKASARIL